jgi:hypothetical protein
VVKQQAKSLRIFGFNFKGINSNKIEVYGGIYKKKSGPFIIIKLIYMKPEGPDKSGVV